MKEKSERHNSGKPRWSLIHYQSLLPLVEVLTFGAVKYSVDNWKKGFDKKELLDSMMRHVTALVDGQEFDEESKLHHIGHIMCNAMFYSFHFVVKDRTVFKSKTEIDSVVKKEINNINLPVEVKSQSFGVIQVKLLGQTEFHSGKDYFKYVSAFIDNIEKYKVLEETDSAIFYTLK